MAAAGIMVAPVTAMVAQDTATDARVMAMEVTQDTAIGVQWLAVMQEAGIAVVASGRSTVVDPSTATLLDSTVAEEAGSTVVAVMVVVTGEGIAKH